MAKWRKFLLGFLIAGLLLVAGCYWKVESYKQYCFDEIEALPQAKVGLLLGTTPRLADGRVNLFFKYRIEAAKELIDSGKVDTLLISGDNSEANYNEPESMRRALLAKGVAEEKIVLDYAGFRTLDSVIRAKEVFGQEKLTVISQPFHNYRAVFIARSKGLEAVGFNANDVAVKTSLKVRLREVFARWVAVGDVIFQRQPKFLGEKIIIE